MSIRRFAYQEQPSEGPFNVHGLTSRIGDTVAYSYPDRGAWGALPKVYAYPLVLLDNYLLCSRMNVERSTVGDVVYAAPLRGTFTYTEYGSSNSQGIRGALYQPGFTPGTESTTNPYNVPGAYTSVGSAPVATYLGGDKALVAWGENDGSIRLASIEVGKATKHWPALFPGGGIGQVRAIGLSTDGKAVVAWTNGSGLRVSSEIALDGSAAFSQAAAYANPSEGPYICREAVAACMVALGNRALKVVAAREVRTAGWEGNEIVGQAQWLAYYGSASTMELYGPAGANGERPIGQYEGWDSDWKLYKDVVSYGASGGYATVGYETLTSVEWHAEADTGVNWPGTTQPSIIGVDAPAEAPVVPPAPLFWQNHVKTEERR